MIGPQVGARDSRSPGRWRSRLPGLLAAVAALVSAIWVAALLLRRVDGLSAPPYDLAFFQQVVWNVGERGQWVSDFHEGSFLGLHFSPILVIPALVERFLWSDVRVLVLLHAAAVAALVPAAFLFLRATFRPSRAAGTLAAALAIGLPFWGSMQDVIRSDFHPETAGVVLALLAGWAGLTRRPRAMWALGLVALATREDVAYAVAVIGIVVAVRGRGDLRWHGRRLAASAVAWAIVVFGIVMPWIRGGLASDTDRYYAWLGGGLGVFAAPFTMTDAGVSALTHPAAWFVVVGMVASLVLLPLLRPRWFVLVLPPLFALLLSTNWFQSGIRLQYSLILVVPLLVATGMGGRRAIAATLRLRGSRRRRREGAQAAQPGARRWSRRLTGPVLMVATIPALAGAWIQGSLPPFDPADPAFFDRPASIDRLLLVAAGVPSSARLLVDEGLVAPLAGRVSVGRMAGVIPPGDSYALVDRLAWSPTSRIARSRSTVIEALLRSNTRPILVDDGRFVLWGPERP